MPWSEKYAPSEILDILGQDTKPIINHAINNPKGKALLIYGPAGCGKSSSVVALAKERGYELVEINVSELVNSEAVKNIVGNASITGSLFGKRIILIDDVDAFGKKDKGGITELIKCIKKTRTPIFLTAIDPWNQKLRTLRSYCNVLEFKQLKSSTIKKILKKICEKEGVKASDSVLYSIASHSNGDMRAAINNLEMLGSDGEITTFELDAMGYREKPVSIFNGLKTLFKGNFNESLHSLDDVNINIDDRFLWIVENVIKEYENIKEIANSFNWLSRADIFNSRIKRWQYWRFLVYVNILMTCGVNSSRITSNRYIKYLRPTKLLKLWKSKHKRELRKQVALKLKPAFLSSINKIIESLSFITILIKKKKIDYGFTNEEIMSLSP